MVILSLIISVIFILAGYYIKKNPDIISGLYKRKAKYKEVIIPEIAEKTGNTLIATAIIIILGNFVVFTFNFQFLSIWVLLLPILLMGVCLPYISYKVRRKHHSHSASLRNVYIAIGILLLLTCPLLYLIKGTQVVLEKDGIYIKGIYSNFIPYNAIDTVNLLQAIPNIQARQDGFDLGDFKVGSFELYNLGETHLYLHSSRPPFLYIETKGDRRFLINESEFGKTHYYYDIIEDHVDKLKITVITEKTDEENLKSDSVIYIGGNSHNGM